MNVKPEALQGELQNRKPRLLWISGDEPLLVQECVDSVRSHARQTGCTERVSLNAAHPFDWNDLLEAVASRSLFSSKRLIECHLPSAKPGTAGSKVLRQLAEESGSDNLLLIVTSKVTRREEKSSWAKALITNGMHVCVYAPSRNQLSAWVRSRLESRQISADAESLRILTESAEGNLLAASQEIEKLALANGPGTRVDASLLRESLSDGARFDVFDLVDAALGGEQARCIRILKRVREEGLDLIPILICLVRELRLLALMHRAEQQGKPADRQLASKGVWESRRRLLGKAKKRCSLQQVQDLLKLAAHIDLSIKGQETGDPWIGLERLTLKMAGQPVPA